MKVLQIGSIIVAITITAAFPIGKNPSAEPNVAAEAEANPETPKSVAPSVETNHSPGSESSALSEEKTISHSPETPHSKSENYLTDLTRDSSGLSYLSFYPYGELPPARKPADALAIQQALIELNRKNTGTGKPALAARIAIDTGPVVIDAIPLVGRDEDVGPFSRGAKTAEGRKDSSGAGPTGPSIAASSPAKVILGRRPG